jgi:dihydrofolate reductase
MAPALVPANRTVTQPFVRSFDTYVFDPAHAVDHLNILGGATTINQYLAAGLLDELELHVAPIVLAGGARLFAGVDRPIKLEQTRVIDAPGVAHIKYRVLK